MGTPTKQPTTHSEQSPLLPGTLSPTKQTRKSSRPTSCCCLVWDNFFSPLLWFFLTATLLSLLTGAWWAGKEEHKPYVLPLALCSVLPAAVLLYVIYGWKDRDSAPLSLIIGGYTWGILACAPVAILESLATTVFFPSHGGEQNANPYSDTMTVAECIGLAAVSSFLVAAFCEEGFKYLFVTWRAMDESSGRFLTTYGIVVLAVATSLGFATLENATYILAPHTRISDAFLTAAWRSLMSVPLHAVCGAFGGWAIARRQRSDPTAPWDPRATGKSIPLYLAFGTPFIVHGLFDFILDLSPAVTPFLSEKQANLTTNFCIGIAALLVVVSGTVVVWLVSDLRAKSVGEMPREEASAWPSVESIEEGAGCVNVGRMSSDKKDTPLWK